MPISSIHPAMMPRSSRFSTLIAEVIITSLRSGFGASFYFNSLMLPPTSGMWADLNRLEYT